jgi:CubicO group peptidase (beta-lactamase class C family)
MKPGNTGESAWYRHEDSTGAAVIVVKDDVVRLLKTYGMANREIQQAVSEQSSFRLASISKQFIGMAIAMLEDAGRLSLDQTLTEILPDFPPYGREITVRHLLHHLSGLTDYEDLIPVSQTKQVSDQDVLRSNLFRRFYRNEFFRDLVCIVSCTKVKIRQLFRECLAIA